MKVKETFPDFGEDVKTQRMRRMPHGRYESLFHLDMLENESLSETSKISQIENPREFCEEVIAETAYFTQFLLLNLINFEN